MQPAANQNGTSTVTLQISDGTSTGTDTFLLTVNAVNDAPVITDMSKSGTEDTTMTFTSANFTSLYTDVEGTVLQNVRFVTLPTVGQGEMRLSGVAISAGQVISAANLANITFVPAANYNGSPSFTWQAQDNADWSNIAAVTLTIAAVNDTPTTSNFSVNTDEDVTYTFTQSNFTSNFSDVDGDNLMQIQIMSLPSGTAGVLKYNNVNVTVNQVITTANL
jgi:hypothetical protein